MANLRIINFFRINMLLKLTAFLFFANLKDFRGSYIVISINMLIIVNLN